MVVITTGGIVVGGAVVGVGHKVVHEGVVGGEIHFCNHMVAKYTTTVMNRALAHGPHLPTTYRMPPASNMLFTASFHVRAATSVNAPNSNSTILRVTSLPLRFTLASTWYDCLTEGCGVVVDICITQTFIFTHTSRHQH